MKTVTAGTQVEMRATFKTKAGVLVDPSTVSCRLRRLGDDPIDLPATRESVGVWVAWYTPESAGQFQYRFAGAGDVIVAGEGSFACNTSF